MLQNAIFISLDRGKIELPTISVDLSSSWTSFDLICIIIPLVQCIVLPNIDSGLTSLLSHTNVKNVDGVTLLGQNDRGVSQKKILLGY